MCIMYLPRSERAKWFSIWSISRRRSCVTSFYSTTCCCWPRRVPTINDSCCGFIFHYRLGWRSKTSLITMISFFWLVLTVRTFSPHSPLLLSSHILYSSSLTLLNYTFLILLEFRIYCPKKTFVLFASTPGSFYFDSLHSSRRYSWIMTSYESLRATNGMGWEHPVSDTNDETAVFCQAS